MKLSVFCFFATLMLAATALRVPSAQTGSDSSVVWTPAGKHVLQTGNNIGRTVDVTLKFANAFQVVPQVLITHYLLDWQAGQPQGYMTDVYSVATDSFTVRFTALSNRAVYSLFIQWLAIDDPSVLVGYATTTTLGDLSTGAGERVTTLKVPFTWPSNARVPAQDTLVVSHFILGAQFTTGNYSVSVESRSLTPQGGLLDVYTWDNTNVGMIKIAYIVGDASTLWVSSDTGFRVPDNYGSYPWVKRSPSGAVIQSSFVVPDAFAAAGVSSIVGITGYDADQRVNMRLVVQNKRQVDSVVTFDLGTWWDSKSYALEYRMVQYKPNTSIQLWDPNCAELFNQCNYQGDTIKICDQVDSFNAKGWKGPLRSINLPEGKNVRLFNQEAGKGEWVTYRQSSPCLDVPASAQVQG